MNLHGFSARLKEAQVAPKRGSERSYVIGLFLTKLNSERGKYPPLKASRIGMMLAPIKSVKDLRAFYSECLYQKNFSSYFFWSTNPKKH